MLQLTRFIAIVIRFFRQGKPRSLVSRTPFKVRLPDIDSYWHMNNARYLAMMDLARMDLMLRSGWLKICRAEQIKPVVVDVNIRYRKELKTGARYEIETQATEVEGRKIWCDQRFMVGDVVHAEARVGMLFLTGDGVASRETVRQMGTKLGIVDQPEPLRQAS